MRLYHVGIVVPKIHDSLGEITEYIKFEIIGLPTTVGSQKVNICFLKIGEPFLELMEPIEGSSPISEFAKKKVEGFITFVLRSKTFISK